MSIQLLLLTAGALVIGDAAGAPDGCSYYQTFLAGQTFQVLSPSYPYNYPRGTNCRWEAIAPTNSKFILSCSEFSVPYSYNCVDDRLGVSPTGDSSLYDAHLYCGSGSFTLQSTNNRILMALNSPYYSNGGRFQCTLTATVPTTPKPPTCDCGWKKESRIVNGHDTGVNEYPMMAGLVDANIKEVICGATVIATRYCVTAAHCLLNLQPPRTGILVGDHDLSKANETNSTKLVIVESFRSHPNYIAATFENDIAVIRVTKDIVFSLEVGPACLPFNLRTTAPGNVVKVLGWGTTEFTGPKSDVLQETELDVVDIRRCQQEYGSKVSSTNQLCSYRNGTDTCQADSGGPVLLPDANDRLYILGVISYGRDCAQEYPAVSTRVYPYIDWIRSVTPDANYCVR